MSRARGIRKSGTVWTCFDKQAPNRKVRLACRINSRATEDKLYPLAIWHLLRRISHPTLYQTLFVCFHGALSDWRNHFPAHTNMDACGSQGLGFYETTDRSLDLRTFEPARTRHHSQTHVPGPSPYSQIPRSRKTSSSRRTDVTVSLTDQRTS